MEAREVWDKRRDESENPMKSGEGRTNESPQRHFGGMVRLGV